MKKIFVLLLTVLMVLSLAACRKPAEDNPQVQDTLEDAIDRLVKCTIMGDPENLEKMAPEAFWLHYESTGTPRSTLLNEAKSASQMGHQFFKNYLGENFTYETMIFVRENLNSDTLKTLGAWLAEQRGIPADLLTAATTVTVDVTLTGTEEIIQTIDTTVFQIGGQWYCGAYFIGDQGAYVSFEIEGMIGG